MTIDEAVRRLELERIRPPARRNPTTNEDTPEECAARLEAATAEMREDPTDG